jgi:hypothetical protein
MALRNTVFAQLLYIDAKFIQGRQRISRGQSSTASMLGIF